MILHLFFQKLNGERLKGKMTSMGAVQCNLSEKKADCVAGSCQDYSKVCGWLVPGFSIS